MTLTACETQSSLKIATASNMQFAMEEIAETFENEYKIKVDLIVSSSGKLTSQIEQGAPYDVFVSANMKYPNYLFNKGLTTNQPQVYAYGQLVLWTMNEFEPSINGLTSSQINKIAIANPKTAPYGTASVDVLKKYNIYSQVQDKLIYGESISQCNQFITTQSADVGFTAMSIVKSPKMKNKGHWIQIDTSNYTPIEQGVVILEQTNQIKNAQLFYDFLFSNQAQGILKKYGYLSQEN